MADPHGDALRAGYATVAAAYADELSDELAGKPLDRAFLRAFVEEVTTGPILDVGCGPGHIAAYLADRGATVEGLDLSPAMIAEAQERHSRVDYRVGDMFALPQADRSVGAIVAFYAIVHHTLAELDGAFREFARVLVPGGVLALAFHAGDAVTHVDELFGQKTALDFRFHPPDAVVAAVTACGFELRARLDREPYPDVEHPSRRTYLLLRRS